jgi:6-phosphogluconolactonase (cycloisomerase 2 family)
VLAATLLATTLLGGTAAGALAQERDDDQRGDGGAHAVFVQTNDPTHNQILAYQRSANGTLTLAGTYDTGGRGGQVPGAVVDPLASQNSLVYDAAHGLLLGVNAGSNTVYSFKIEGNRLSERHVVGSDGVFPASITVHHNLAYVLNAEGTGSVHGYRIDDEQLQPISGSTRSLGLAPVTNFLTSPGQIGFTPDGQQLVVTTKANGSHIDVFQVQSDGRLSAAPKANVSSTPVPFGFTFDPQRHLVVTEAATSHLSTYALAADGTLTALDSLSDGQAALCWIVGARGTYYGANAGSNSISSFHINAGGHIELLTTTAAGTGPVDMAVSPGGRFLNVQLGGEAKYRPLPFIPTAASA